MSVLLPAPAVPAVGGPSARVETWAAKTYPFSDPDPVPCVGAKRYPYCRFDGSTAVGATQSWQTVVLENGRIRVKLVPAIGGKVWGATDLRTGVDFIYDNHVVKFRDVAARGPWTSGGIEFNFGIVGHAPSCSTPVDWFVRTNADASVSYFAASEEYVTRSRWQVEVRLRPDAEEFETHTTWYNASGLPQPYYHWMNAAYSVRGNPRFLFPGSQYIGHAGDVHPWPLDEKGRDISVFEGNAFGGPKSYHILPGANEFYGIWWPEKDVGAYHRSEACEKYGRKIWLWALSRAGGIWEDLLTDADGQYTELQSGRCFQQPQMESVETPFDHPVFVPGSTERFSERWGVLRKEGLESLEGLKGPGPAGRPVASPADFDRESARGLYLRGRHCFSDRDNSYAEAESFFRQSLAKDAYFRPSLVALAALENRRGNYAACHRLCEKVLSLDTYDTDANYLDGFAYFAEGDSVNARDRLGVAAFDNRNRAPAYALIARTFLCEGKADKALAFAEKALAANAASLDALLVKAIALRGTDAFKPFADAVLADYPLFHAVRYLRDGESFRTLVRNELPEQTYIELGSWFAESGLKDEARQLFALASPDPVAAIRRAHLDKDVSALSAVARHPAAGVFPFRRESLPALRWAAEKGGWKCRYHYAVALAALDRKSEADALFDTLDEADEAVVFLLRATRRTGDARLADLRRAQALGGDWRTGRALCAYYDEAGDAAAFLREAETWLKRYPKTNAIQSFYAKALHVNGRNRECLDYLKDVVFLPSELRGNVSEIWRAAQKALGLEITYPENLGTGKPFPDVEERGRPQLEVAEDGAAVVVRGARAELRIEDGRITSLKGPGGLAATGGVREPCGRAGLGVLTSAFDMSFTHWPFVSPYVQKNARPDVRQPCYRSPEARSVRTVSRGDGTVTIRWKGLSDGTAFHPDDELELEFGTDDAGAITLRSRGRSPDGGVFGVQTPIEGLRDDGAFVLPFLGGMRFKIADMPKGVWSLICDFVYCQAPVAAIEMPGGSFGVWSEDDAFTQYQAYFPKGDRTATFAFEWMNIMPFETKHEVVAPVLKIDAFPDKDWLGAATPYRAWFRKRFAAELATRDRNTNPETAVAITSSWDRGKRFDEHLDTLTNLFGRTVLFHHGKQTTESTLPPHRYDWGLPGHTPDLSYLKGIAERHKRGIQCACYAVAFCANYQSEAFKRDRLEEFALPTINCSYMYRAMSKDAVAAAKANGTTETTQALQTMNNTLREVATDVQPQDTPAEKWRKMKYKDQELVYLDVNSARWRKYIVDVHKRLVDALGLDVLYEDCLGVIRDTGNGVQDGTSGAMGSYLLARELQQALPVAFQSEGGPAPVAMVSSYPLNSADFMRDKPKLMRHRFFHSVPLCAYLFGYRPLCGGHEAFRPVERNFVSSACNDALGGLGFVTEPPWNTESGIFDHMVVRSLTFARKGLKPFFPADGRMPDGVTCLYRDREGGVYRYCGDRPVQVMYGPGGTPLWGRASGVTEFDVPGLELPGWPMRKGSRHYGLSTDSYYALFPIKPDGKDVTKVYGEIGETEKVVCAYDTPAFTYLELAGKEPKITFKTRESKPETSRAVSRASGIELFGTEKKLADALRCRPAKGVELLRVEEPAAFRTIDFVHTVRKGEAVRLVAQNREWGTWDSDGCRVGVYVNGRRQVEYDTAPEKNPKWVYQHAKRHLYDYRMHKFTVPLDKWAGETVLVSVRVDAKNGTYDDRQDISLPEIVPYAGEPLDEIVKGMVPESAYRNFNGGEPPRE